MVPLKPVARKECTEHVLLQSKAFLGSSLATQPASSWGLRQQCSAQTQGWRSCSISGCSKACMLAYHCRQSKQVEVQHPGNKGPCFLPVPDSLVMVHSVVRLGKLFGVNTLETPVPAAGLPAVCQRVHYHQHYQAETPHPGSGPQPEAQGGPSCPSHYPFIGSGIRNLLPNIIHNYI